MHATDDRLLTEDEQALIGKTRQPAIKTMSDDDLVGVARELRRSREAGRQIANVRRRALRGQKTGFGETRIKPPGEQGGIGSRLTLIAGALKRANKEIARRHARRKRSDRKPPPAAPPISSR